jgi:hypothetical protein
LAIFENHSIYLTISTCTLRDDVILQAVSVQNAVRFTLTGLHTQYVDYPTNQGLITAISARCSFGAIMVFIMVVLIVFGWGVVVVVVVGGGGEGV